MATIANMFWADSFWLNSNLTWDDYKNKPGSEIYKPQVSDMYWCLPLAFVMIIFRFYIFERYISAPLAEWLGVREKKRREFTPNPALEELYLQNGITSNNNLESVAKKTDMSVREVERWLRNRQALSKPCKLKKFTECSWHFLFYGSSFVCGLYILWDKPWMWDTSFCWKGWPHLHVSTDIYLYYLIELAFYWSLVFTVLVDNKRKDFKEMMIHHVATILLLSLSWVTNCTRIGSLVMLTHDAADSPLALAKLLKYIGREFLCDATFVVFLIVWVLSRLIYYPTVVLYSAYFELYEYIDPPPSLRLCSNLLVLLQVLHLIWTYMILKILWSLLTKSKVTDVRSDSESD